MKKNLWFIMKIQKFWRKSCFKSRILGKTPVQSEQILASCDKRFPFFNYFQISHASSNSMKELSKSLIFKNNLIFLKKCGFRAVQPPHFFFKFFIIIRFWLNFALHIFSWLLVENYHTTLNFFTNGGPPSLKYWNLPLLSVFDYIL